MPTYDYRCSACGHVFEAIHRIADPSPETCPACGDRAIRKALSAPTFVFKGTGWAKKDRASAKGHADTAAAAGSNGDSKAGDAKSDDTRASDSKAGDAKSHDAKSGDTRGSDSKASDAKSGDATPSTSGGGAKTAAPAATD